MVFVTLTLILGRALGEDDLSIEAAILVTPFNDDLRAILKRVGKHGVARVANGNLVLAIRDLELRAVAILIPLDRPWNDHTASKLDPTIR